jgi:hypothetical protein
MEAEALALEPGGPSPQLDTLQPWSPSRGVDARSGYDPRNNGDADMAADMYDEVLALPSDPEFVFTRERLAAMAAADIAREEAELAAAQALATAGHQEQLHVNGDADMYDEALALPPAPELNSTDELLAALVAERRRANGGEDADISAEEAEALAEAAAVDNAHWLATGQRAKNRALHAASVPGGGVDAPSEWDRPGNGDNDLALDLHAELHKQFPSPPHLVFTLESLAAELSQRAATQAEPRVNGKEAADAAAEEPEAQARAANPSREEPLTDTPAEPTAEHPPVRR